MFTESTMLPRSRYFTAAYRHERFTSWRKNQNTKGAEKTYAVPFVSTASPRLNDIKAVQASDLSLADKIPNTIKQTSQKETTRSFWVLLDWRMPMGTVAAMSPDSSWPRAVAANRYAMSDTPMMHPAMLNH